MKQHGRLPDPTPQEIAAACEIIQAGWSEDERRARRFGMMPGKRGAHSAEIPDGWQPPVVIVADLSALDAG